MKRTIGIIVLVIVVLALLILGYNYFFGKPEDGTPCDSDNDGFADGSYLDGNCIKTETQPGYVGPNIDQNITPGGELGIGFDKLVSSSDVKPAYNPNSFFQNISVSTMSSFNLITDDKRTRSNPSRIRFTSQFNNPYPQFVWYKNWLYILDKKLQGNTGVDTYYYKVDKSSLPSQIRILTPNQCSIFKFKISGVEYKYSNTALESTPTMKIYCVYDKQ